MMMITLNNDKINLDNVKDILQHELSKLNLRNDNDINDNLCRFSISLYICKLNVLHLSLSRLVSLHNISNKVNSNNDNNNNNNSSSSSS